MPFLPPSQQRQSKARIKKIINSQALKIRPGLTAVAMLVFAFSEG